VSRHGRDHTRRFSDIAAAVDRLSARTLVLDGESAIFDQQLRSRERPCAPRKRSPPSSWSECSRD
jgi:ATP-dependent DNA ligase